MANVGVKRFHKVTQSSIASFSIKRSFVKLITFSSAKKTKNKTKPMRDSESTSKIKTKSRWTFSKFSLCQRLFAFNRYFMETRLYNIFKSKNATKLTKTIIESPYKVLLDEILFNTIKPPVHFLLAVELLTTFIL